MSKDSRRNRLTMGGKLYKLVAMRIDSRRADGRPEQLTIIEDDDTAELSTDTSRNCFITAYVPAMDYSKFAGQIPTIPDETDG